jgi:iron-sulfur cluster insertion protein
MTITITDAAKQKIRDLGSSDNSTFRVAVEGGACQGFQYVFTSGDKIEPSDEVIEFEGGQVLIDKTSLLYIFGSTIDYTFSLVGEKFEVINPNAVSKCGCGVSFSV